MSIIPLATIKQDTHKGDADVLPYLVWSLPSFGISPCHENYETIVACFCERAEKVGIKHYKTPLQTNNGHDPLVDAFQEALDLLMYLTQEAMEITDSDFYLQSEAIKLCIAIAKKLEAKYGTDSL